MKRSIISDGNENFENRKVVPTLCYLWIGIK